MKSQTKRVFNIPLPDELLAPRPFLVGGRDVRVLSDPTISVEVTTPERFMAIGSAWRDLAERALERNAFMAPEVAFAAAQASDAPVHVLLAWDFVASPAEARLIGAWVLARRRPACRLPIDVLKTPIQDHAALGTPVLDRERGAEAMTKMLDAIHHDPRLPKLLQIDSLGSDGPAGTMLADAVSRRGGGWLAQDRRQRPMLRKSIEAEGPAVLSPSRRKTLRQRRRRLDEQGTVTFTKHAHPGEVGAAFDEFVVLEASGWKGRASQRGHAIRRDPATERFFRLSLEGLARRGLATIDALRIDGRPVAMQITIRSGATAFTWKSAYDEALRACAPGIVLLSEITSAMTGEAMIDVVDSCNQRDDGYMAEFWAGRCAISDVVLDARDHPSPSFALLAGAERAERQLKAAARRARSALREIGQRFSARAVALQPPAPAPPDREAAPIQAISSGGRDAR